MRSFSKNFITIAIVFAVLFVLSKKSCSDFGIKPKDTSIEKGSIGYTSDIEIRYQYSCLTEKEQEIYDLFLTAMSNGDRGVNLNYYKVSKETCKKVFQAVIYDNPDLFWVTKKYSTLASENTINALYFKYFDGSVFDDFNVETYNEIEYKSKADQDKIKERINKFKQAVVSVRNNVANLTAYETEIYFHNYLTKTITYNHDAAKTTDIDLNFLKAKYYDAFNSYGAIVNGSAVCEGYAELFQYLCLLSNINCTQIIGTYEGGAHAWNAVWLSDSWYFVDVTFDDLDSEEVACVYDYLNIDFETLNKTHKIDETFLSVPECNSNKLNYCKNDLINYKDNMITKNYPELIAKEIKSGKNYITIYFPDSDYNYNSLKRLLYNISPSFNECIKENGKRISKYFTVNDNYAFILLK